MTAAAHRKAMGKLLQQACGRLNVWDVFSDFVALSALSVSNVVDFRQQERREAEYLQIIRRYEPAEQGLFPKVFAELVEALEAEPHDALGMTFESLELANSARGQFFTPYHLCRALADLTIGDGAHLHEAIARQGYVTVCESAVGAGAMVIAFAQAMQSAGFDYQEQLHVTATDVDARAAHMAYLQFSLLHIPAVVHVGNTLSGEIRETFLTPAHVMGAWSFRLRDRQAPAEPLVAAPPREIALADGEQLALFSEAA